MEHNGPATEEDLKADLGASLELADQLGLMVVGALLASAIDLIPVVKH